jgi:DNA-binding GntR family transcriptional regulator
MSLGQIENLSLREQVAAKLRNAILNGALIPGQELVEAEIASQLGVSRAPIREAFQILSAEGLTESVPYHGTKVRILTQTDVEELYSLRSVLEEFAVQRVIDRDDPEALSTLRDLYDAMSDAAENGNLEQASTLDRAFHDGLIEASGHQMLSSTWNTVSLRVQQVMALRQVRRRITRPDEIKQIAYSHLPIIEAIAEANSDKAVRLIREHIATSGDLVAADWVSQEKTQ